jgi:hypothetical protein
MKRLSWYLCLLGFCMPVFFISCRENSTEEPALAFTPEEQELNAYLEGIWEGTEYSYGVEYKTERITFSSLPAPKLVELTNSSGVVPVKHTYKLLGRVHMVTAFGSSRNTYDSDGSDYFYSYDSSDKSLSLFDAVNDVILVTRVDRKYIDVIDEFTMRLGRSKLTDTEDGWITFSRE